jgi:hypothetical protein
MGPYYDHQVGRFERPDPWEDRETMLARARQARADAAAEMFGTLWARLKTATKAVTGSARHALTPRDDVHHPGRHA